MSIAAPAAAQQGADTLQYRPDGGVGAPATQPWIGAGGALLDAPVDRAQYVMGPGDRVELSLFGDLNRLHSLAVTPEGSLVIPTVGVVNVLGLNLDQAQARVRERVFRFYRNVDVHLTLSQVRQFKVFMVGDVPTQGVRLASSATRVSEVISNADDDQRALRLDDQQRTLRRDDDPRVLRPDDQQRVLRRNVHIRRASGETLEVDLARFRQVGDLSANPLLREGDVLVVPSVDRTVHLFGRVAFPGAYEYRRGETLAQLLEVANGGGEFPSDAADTVRVSRFVGPEQREFVTFTRAAAVGPVGEGFVLQPFDAVYVPSVANFMQQRVAVVEGQVLRPGTYPIRPETTTVRELVALAGGLRQEASLTGATLRRDAQFADNAALRRLQEVPIELLSPDERRIQQVRAQADEFNVVIDFHRLFLEGASVYDQPIRAGDVLTIPERHEEVRVLGAVLQPGIVQHVTGRSVSDFVALAGGFGREADRSAVTVLRAQTGNRVSARDARTVEPGDIIVVPYRERVNPMQVLQTAGTIVTTLTSLVVLVVTLR